MSEEWRQIQGYEGAYEVSSTGRVRSIDRTVTDRNGKQIHFRGRVLTQTLLRNGYLAVGLHRGARGQTKTVHRLVLEAFAGAAPVGMEACHNDGDRLHNTPDNLRWASRSANLYDAVRHGTHRAASKTSCKHGHSFTPENTYRRTGGGRNCRACAIERSRSRYNSRKAAA